MTNSFPLSPSTLETIDRAVYNWLDSTMNINTTTNEGWKKVKINWVSAERAHQMKNDVHKGTLVLPIITVERGEIAKKLDFWGRIAGLAPKFDSHDGRGGELPIGYSIMHEKTSNFQNADANKEPAYGGHMQLNFPKASKKVVYEVYTIPAPNYIHIDYKIMLRTEYMQQMNDMMQPFLRIGGRTNYFVMEEDGHRYEGFVEGDFGIENNVSKMDDAPRSFETEVTVKVLGYTLGDGVNDPLPLVTRRETATEFKITRERAMTQDEIEHLGKYYKGGVDKGYRP